MRNPKLVWRSREAQDKANSSEEFRAFVNKIQERVGRILQISAMKFKPNQSHEKAVRKVNFRTSLSQISLPLSF